MRNEDPSINVRYYSIKFDLYFVEVVTERKCGRISNGKTYKRFEYYTFGTGKKRKEYHKPIQRNQDKFNAYLRYVKQMENVKLGKDNYKTNNYF